MRFACQSCGRAYVISDDLAARAFRMKCKGCGQVIVHRPASAPPPPPVQAAPPAERHPLATPLVEVAGVAGVPAPPEPTPTPPEAPARAAPFPEGTPGPPPSGEEDTHLTLLRPTRPPQRTQRAEAPSQERPERSSPWTRVGLVAVLLALATVAAWWFLKVRAGP
ncbi:MAG: MJ0042-type zinc finger domain-containing protein [Deltaproteobacteria bacterium]